MPTKRLFIGLLLTGLILGNFGWTSQIEAQTTSTNMDPSFDPNIVLTDNDMFDVYGMTYDYLKHFLQNKGALADLKVKDIDGVEKPAIDIIWRVSQSYKINPKYLLALLQKEQSLVEDADPSARQLDWAAGYAVCDSCSKDDPVIQQYKGFANQLEYAAKQHREKYLIQLLAFGATIGGKSVGKTMLIDGQSVTPGNNATAMLYTYTPHLHGNYNLWKIWQRWFALAYPNGTIVRGSPSKTAYLIQNGEKRAFANESVLLSMADPKKIITVSDTDLAAYSEGSAVKFPKYSIIKTDEGNLYLIASNGKRLFASDKVMHKFGFLDDELIEAAETDLSDLTLLDPITDKTAFPLGALVKTAKSSTVWYVENGVKHALQDEVFIKLYFPGRPIKTVAAATIESYALGEAYVLHDGELVRGKSSPAVYVVEAGQLRPIPSAEVFVAMGYKWNNVVTLPDRIIAQYEIGPALMLTSPTQPMVLASN